VAATAMTMTVIDLLAGQAETAKAVLDTCSPQMSKRQYLDLPTTAISRYALIIAIA
jgi:hypothetical protein